jgi:ATP-dependent Clp protease protease subunit
MSRRINRDDIDKLHEFNLFIPARLIWVGSETQNDDMDIESGTDAFMAERLIKNLLILDNASSEPITILMNNVGGEETHGMAIYDAIRCCRCDVTIKVFGQAYSMGSIILQAADHRIMAPNAKQMAHYGTLSLEGHAKTVEKTMKDSAKMNKWMERMYLERIQVKNPDYTMEQLQSLLDHDTFLTAKESVAMGLADEVLTEHARTKK